MPSGCFCTAPITHQIQCRNITIFPLFPLDTKNSVTSIVFHEGSILALAPFSVDQWSKLREVYFINTPRMTCNAIRDVTRPGLRIFSRHDICLNSTIDASTPTNETNVRSSSCPDCALKCGESIVSYILLSICLLILTTYAIAIIHRTLTRRRGRWTVPEVSAVRIRSYLLFFFFVPERGHVPNCNVLGFTFQPQPGNSA